MKPFTSLLTAALLSAASLSACGGSENRMSIQEQTEKRFQLNPHPTKAYRIKIKINDAPGPLKLIGDMYVGYTAQNCSYVINELEGASTNPHKDIPNKIRQIGQDEYESIIYFDAMQDEDYFGKGVCKWEVENFGTAFKATGKPEETTFNVSDVMEKLIEKKTLTKYYWKARYPYYRNEDGSIALQNDGIEGMPKGVIGYVYFGADSLKGFNKEQLKNLFSISVTLEEIK
ncbi:MAG: hypothetical protein Q4A84_09320 [Neisseria sp.]|uniref:hypothetical protein n=1 Tax=Neisseria sp. TaxID=192066 RepID=UPI0026DC9927|nr:hypothetical protein [Neisseria sp.]MDO4641877.1 hypothetical protein [Neisseria sp.]